MEEKNRADKTWKNFKIHFSKAITKKEKRSDTLKEIDIVNQIKAQVDTNKDNTKTIAQVQHEQNNIIETLKAQLKELEVKNQTNIAQHPPPKAPLQQTDTNIPSQTEAMFKVLMAAQANGSSGSSGKGPGSGRQKWNQNDND